MLLRFYISSIIANLLIVFLTFEVFEVLIEEVFIYNTYSHLLAKLSVIADLGITYFFYRFLFWLIAPLTILFFKKHQNHWLVFIVLNSFIALFYFLYNFNRVGWERLIYEISFLIIVGFSISILIHFSQKVIGEKLLPARYVKP